MPALDLAITVLMRKHRAHPRCPPPPAWPRPPVLQLLFHVECSRAACSVTAWYAADVTVRNGSGRLLRAGRRATRGGRGSFLDFVRKQDTATAAVASIEDAAECGERADALVSGLLGRVMRQRRTVAAALDYIRALSRETRANCWELALRAGHEGPHRMQALLSRHQVVVGGARGMCCRAWRRTSCPMTRMT